MLVQTLQTTRDVPRAIRDISPPPAVLADNKVSACGLLSERAWRRPFDDAAVAPNLSVVVSRWRDERTARRYEEATAPPDRHVVGIALVASRVRLERDGAELFHGRMSAGIMHVTAPAQRVRAEFEGPCDFIHLYVKNDYIQARQAAAKSGEGHVPSEIGDLVVRDPLSELLVRTLIKGGSADDGAYAEQVGRTIVMRLVALERPLITTNAISKWRLRRVQDYVDRHLADSVSLTDLAAAAGLSRMHFASQFRNATGWRPHEYVLQRRIASAKVMLAGSDTSLAEIALDAGFQTQSHFTTVFKRLVGETPARWRRARADDENLSERS